MQLISLSFLLFFPIVLLLNYAVPDRHRWIVLLLASYFFYGLGNPVIIVFLFSISLLVFTLGKRIARHPAKNTARIILITGVLLSAAYLILSKYFNMVGQIIHRVNEILLGSYFQEIAPIILLPGVSFYSLKLIGYLVDVYNGKHPPESHFGYFALYVSFFPQILSGPIDRAGFLIPRLKTCYQYRYIDISNGFKKVLWGVFKKIVIADRLRVIVAQVFNHPHQFSGDMYFVVATFCFSIQIYCDFSGYSDIAIGLAEMLGIESGKNFNLPYFSRNIRQFWNRWHISLSTWLRDYLFLPIAYLVFGIAEGSKVGKRHVEKLGYISGMSITMLIGGLWHGADWTFVFWGLIHALYLVFSYSTKKKRKKWVKTMGLHRYPRLYRGWNRLATFFLVTFAWIFFRANSLEDAWRILYHFVAGSLKVFISLVSFGFARTEPLFEAGFLNNLGVDPFELKLAAGAIIVLMCAEAVFIGESGNSIKRMFHKHIFIRWGFYYSLLFFVLWFGMFKGTVFIYALF